MLTLFVVLGYVVFNCRIQAMLTFISRKNQKKSKNCVKPCLIQGYISNKEVSIKCADAQRKYYSVAMILSQQIKSQIIHSQIVWDLHDNIKWKHFPRYWPFVREMHR